MGGGVFRDRILRRFNGKTAIAQASAALYSEQQRPNELIEVFLARKNQLYNHLHPDTPEFPVSLIPLLIQQIRPELCPHLLAARPRTLEALMDLATGLETAMGLATLQPMPNLM